MTIDYRKITIEELKEQIKEASGGLIEDSQLELKRAELIKVHKELVKIENEEVKEESTTPNVPPTYSSPEWHDYVMSQFSKEELVPDSKGNRNPTVSGLRRVSQLLLGDIVSSKATDVKTTLHHDGPGKAVVSYEITFNWSNSGEQRVFGGVASSWFGNTDDVYTVHAEAIAETRAEGRALRKALGIRAVCADELTNKDTSEIVERFKEKLFDKEDNGLINDTQIKVITTLCDRLSINREKFINSGSRQYGSINNVSYNTAIEMIKTLSKYQSENVIPENLKIEGEKNESSI